MCAVPRKAGVHQRGEELRGLPRGHSPAADGTELRAVPHGAGLEYRGTASEGSPESLSTVWRARRRALRGVPQASGDGAVPGTFDGLRFVHLKDWQSTTNPP